MTAPTLSVPLAVVISIATAVGGAWLGVEKTNTSNTVRTENIERRLETVEVVQKTLVPEPEFTIVLSDLKRELDDIRSDVKEIRRSAGVR